MERRVLPSLSLPQPGAGIAVPPTSVEHIPALLMLYNNQYRNLWGPVTTGLSIIAGAFPAFREFFPVPEQLLKDDGTPVSWIPRDYGQPTCKIEMVPDDLEHRLGIYHGACCMMTALFRDARDGSYMKAAEGRFNAFKAAANISAVHAPYQALDGPSFVAWFAGQPWAHEALIQMLGEQIPGVGASLMAQMDMLAREGQMTTLNAIKTFLSEVDSTLILLPGVAEDIPKFKDAWMKLQDAVSEQWFPYIKATYHPEAKKISPNAFPKLASAALYHASETNATMKQYRLGKPIPGGIPENKLREAYKKKLKRAEGDLISESTRKILEEYGITSEVIAKTYKKKKRSRSSSSSSSE